STYTSLVGEVFACIYKYTTFCPLRQHPHLSISMRATFLAAVVLAVITARGATIQVTSAQDGPALIYPYGNFTVEDTVKEANFDGSGNVVNSNHLTVDSAEIDQAANGGVAESNDGSGANTRRELVSINLHPDFGVGTSGQPCDPNGGDEANVERNLFPISLNAGNAPQ
ncbi:hypothetical protein BXZ70DRAFT_100652, partial [Cristinia sonorae]